MFTGLVEYIGTINKVDRTGEGLKLLVSRPHAFDDVNAGDSISVSGTCLTVTDLKGDVMAFDVVGESGGRTTLGDLRKGDRVNLERALKVGQRLGGHFVTGHIDCRAAVKKLSKNKDNVKLELTVPKGYSRYLALKGSITIDGVSLTIGEVAGNNFSVYLIPHTLKHTTLGLRKKGEAVNIETDVLAKYLLEQKPQPKPEPKPSQINSNFLHKHGFA